MKRNLLTLASCCTILSATIACLLLSASSTHADPPSPPAEPTAEFKPVDDMHHFMEYINEPVIEDLNQAMEKKPVAKQDWGRIKSGAFILAETSSLVAQRRAEKEDLETWKSASLTVHQGATAMYQAARAKDFEAATKHFAAMKEGCASCHKAFR